MKRAFAVALSAVVGVTPLLAGCGGETSGTSRDGLTPLTFQMNWTWEAPDYTFFAVAEELGYFEDEGLDVTFREGTGSATTVQVIGGGKGDLGWSDLPTMMMGVGEGLPIKSVAVMHQQNQLGLLFKADAGIDSIDDLAGKKIAVGQGGADASLLPAVLAANDMDQDDVDVVYTVPSGKDAAMLAGRVDAAGVNFPLQGPADEALHDVDLDWISFSDAGLSLLGTSIFGRQDWIEDNPETVDAFMRAVQRAVDYSLADPDEAAQIFYEAHPKNYTEELARAQLDIVAPMIAPPADKPIGWSDEKDWKRTESTLETYMGLQPAQSINDYFTNAHVE